MCGIVGAAAERNVVPILLDGLMRLEYRGYDSAGLAVITQDTSGHNQLQFVRCEGKVQKLIKQLAAQPLYGQIGIAHTRWATHGKPCELNAHPQVVAERIAVVHNGIIENHEEIYQQLAIAGYQRYSETDTEAIAAWIHKQVTSGDPLLTAVTNTVAKLSGAYAIAVIDRENPQQIVVARQGSPLVIGVGIDEYFIASDPLALQKVSQEFIYLEDGDIALIKHNQLEIYDLLGNKAVRNIHKVTLERDSANKGEYRHFMQKEIFEQPRAISATLQGRINKGMVLEQTFGRNAAKIFANTNNVQIVACGTSYYAGLVGKYWLEELAGISCNVEIASEFRYRKHVVPRNTLFVTLSQSGETADTLAALKITRAATPKNSLNYASKIATNVIDLDQAKHNKRLDPYLARLAICNVPESSLVREADMAFLTHAGPEVGVASTKAFSTQLVALLLLTLAIGKHKSATGLSKSAVSDYITQLIQVPKYIEQVLGLDQQVAALAKIFTGKQHALFLGRGTGYPLALEGALKLKEISYIHAEAYPGGELKHGPLALVDKDMPVVVLAPKDALFDKIKANIAEVHARGGKLIVITSGKVKFDLPYVEYLQLPEVPSILMPLLMAIPMQLLAYHVAVDRGTDVDQPRNLAKSVTVE